MTLNASATSVTGQANILTTLTIFIQCHNRPAYARCAIESALRQTNHNFKLVVSDNSSNDELQDLVRAEFPAIDYRRRPSTLTSIQHFSTSIAETDTEFLCLFHDDDLLEPDYVDAMLKAIASHPDAVAYGCNANIMNQDGSAQGQCFESENQYIVIKNPRALAGRYFSRFPNGFAPFPAYIYRTSVIKEIPINPQAGGKYSDFTWLLEISKTGAIVWNGRKLIRYRLHATNDSGTESTRDRFRLLGYLKLNRASVGQNIINDYRFFLYKKLYKGVSIDRALPRPYLDIFKRYLQVYRVKRFARPETYAYLGHKLGKFFRKNST
jgi:glycosyltransferase involved in cell wall biosynthesis